MAWLGSGMLLSPPENHPLQGSRCWGGGDAGLPWGVGTLVVSRVCSVYAETQRPGQEEAAGHSARAPARSPPVSPLLPWGAFPCPYEEVLVGPHPGFPVEKG